MDAFRHGTERLYPGKMHSPARIVQYENAPSAQPSAA
jgi:hypothetical protein